MVIPADAVKPPIVLIIPGSGPTDRAANMAPYSDPSLPIAPGGVEAIVEFVTRRMSSPDTKRN